MRSVPTKTIEFNGSNIEIVTVPPPHVMFLGSKMQEDDVDALKLAARAAGLAGLCVRAIDGEKLEYAAKLPRDMEALESFGAGFLMSLYELGIGMDGAVALFEAVLKVYNEGSAPNPS